MNERIKKLARQAGIVFWEISGDVEHASKEQLEKFADLLIQECIFAVENHGGMCGGASSHKIKQHFGVE